MPTVAHGASGWLACLIALLGTMLAGGTASAQLNQLEIRQPKVEAGEVELEYLGEYHFGQPRRRFIEEDPGAFEFDGNEFNRQRHTIGLSYGLTRWLSLQVAVEAEQERFEDAETAAKARGFDELMVTEVELESTIVLIPTPKEGGFGLAALVEYNLPFNRDETDQLFLGSALQYAWGQWTATANLYAVRHFGGREELDGIPISDERWDFQYAAQLKYRVNDSLALALEGYGVVERLGDSGTRSEERELFGDFDRHLLGPVVYYSWGGDDGRPARKARKGLRVRSADANGRNGDANGKNDDDDDKNGGSEGPSYTLGAGVLFGLNDNTSNVALKWSLEVEF
jgi:hypothetical protein